MSPALQVPQVGGLLTNERGEYRRSPLPIGLYAVVYEMQGFQPVRREGVRLAVGFVATLNQVLSLIICDRNGHSLGHLAAGRRDKRDDQRRPVVGRIGALPATRDGWPVFLAQVPGLRTNLDVGHSSLTYGVQIRAAGQSGQSWPMLDGVLFSTSNPGNDAGAHIDFNVIELSRVQTVGVPPNAGSGICGLGHENRAATKSRRTLAYGSGTSLEASNINDELRSQGLPEAAAPRPWASGTAGGRMIRDKLWFFMGIRQQGYNLELLNAFHDDGRPVFDPDTAAVPKR